MNEFEATVYIEVPVNIKFSVSPGQKATRIDPEYPAQLQDINFDNNQVIYAMEHAVFGEDSTIEEDLWEEVEKQQSAGQDYWADRKYEEMKEEGLI